MKEYFDISDVDNTLKRLNGDCIPVKFIEYIIIIYNDGTVKHVDAAKIKEFFPNITHTTVDMLSHKSNISEVNVKVDLRKVKDYLNDSAIDISQRFNELIKEKQKKYKNKGT